ncbi:unnamed protein product [Symbiodinium sp. CCMP2592]|nr:unnamed protein product [Symbiodinium sp. CCMP2592]
MVTLGAGTASLQGAAAPVELRDHRSQKQAEVEAADTKAASTQFPDFCAANVFLRAQEASACTLMSRPPRSATVEKDGRVVAAWVSDKGQIAWTSPASDEILTVEKKLGCNISSPDEMSAKWNNMVENTRSSTTEREILNLSNHCVLAEVSGHVEANAIHVKGSSSQDPHVADRGEREVNKYITATADEEKQMNDFEAMAELLAVKQLAT